jgi:hypothetical protein
MSKLPYPQTIVASERKRRKVKVKYWVVRDGSQKWHGVTCSKLSILVALVNTGSWREVLYAAAAPETSSWHGTTTRHRSSQADRQTDSSRNRYTIYHCLIHHIPLSRRTAYNHHIKTARLQLYTRPAIPCDRDCYHRHVLPR